MKKYLFVSTLLCFIGCGSIPSTWKPLDLPSGTNYDKAWSAIISVVSEDFTILQSDKENGLLTTDWKGKMGIITITYRIRILVRITNKNPLNFEIKAERQRVSSDKSWIDDGNDLDTETKIKERIHSKLQ